MSFFEDKPIVPTVDIPHPTKKVRVLTSADVGRVSEELQGLAGKWHEIGTAFRLSEAYLESLKASESTAAVKLGEVLGKWLGGCCCCPTWEALGDFLRTSEVGGEAVADQLKAKYSDTKEEDEAATEGPLLLHCGIEGCVCESLIDTFHAEYHVPLHFPYLEWSEDAKGQEDREKFLRKLTLEFREVVADYDLFHIYAWKALIRRDVKTQSVIDYLERSELFQSFSKIPHPILHLFHNHLPAFKTAKTLTDVFLIMRDHIDIFSHNLMVDIMLNCAGSMRDRRRLDDFRDKYYYFMRRKATLFPRVYTPPPKTGYALVHFGYTKDIDDLTCSEADSFANRLTYNLAVTRFTLKLVALLRKGKGEVEFVYQMPSHARNFVFPIRDEQISALKSEGISFIHCCSYKLEIPGAVCEDELVPRVRPYIGMEMDKNQTESTETEAEGMDVSMEAGPKPYALLPEGSPFRLDADKVPVPPELDKIQEQCGGVGNYMVVLTDPAHKALYAAMALCQHAAMKKQRNEFVKCIILTNSKPRAHEMLDQVQTLLPSVTITLFTGAEPNSITTKTNLDKDIVLMCTTGKFHQEIESDVVNFGTTSLLIVDDCHYSLGQTPLESAFHKYILKKFYSNQKPMVTVPQIVGLTTNPGDRASALDEEAMEKHILKMAGGVDSTVGVLFTDRVFSDTYTPPSSSRPSPKPTLHVKKFMMRERVKDVIVALQVEIHKWEESIGMLSPHHKWTAEHVQMVQAELDSALARLGCITEDGATPPPDLVERVRVLELIQCYALAAKACVEFGMDRALDVLQAPTRGGAVSATTKSFLTEAQFQSFEAMSKDIRKIVSRRSTLLDVVVELVCPQFASHAHKSRGVLFVDTLADAHFLSAEIGKSHFTARPAAVPRCLVASYSTEACLEIEKADYISEQELERGKEGLDAFARGECSLLIVPYALETDPVEIENIHSEFDFLARAHKITHREDFLDAEHVLTLVVSPERKPFAELRKDFDMCRVEAGLRALPSGITLRKRLTRAQEDVMYSHQTRHLFPLSRKKKKQGAVFIDQMVLRCKKCRVYVCHGLEVFSFFVDGGRHCVVPHHDFATRYNTKPYHAKHKTIKRVNRLKRMFCANCGAPWGLICHFPSKGCQLPVILAKNFIFEMDNKYYSIKLWSDALFQLPPIAIFRKFHLHGAEMQVD